MIVWTPALASPAAMLLCRGPALARTDGVADRRQRTQVAGAHADRLKPSRKGRPFPVERASPAPLRRCRMRTGPRPRRGRRDDAVVAHGGPAPPSRPPCRPPRRRRILHSRSRCLGAAPARPSAGASSCPRTPAPAGCPSTSLRAGSLARSGRTPPPEPDPPRPSKPRRHWPSPRTRESGSAATAAAGAPVAADHARPNTRRHPRDGARSRCCRPR
jgi:hypothetical protein